MLDKLLEKLGLSEKESRVYLALLEIGQGTVQQIAQKADVRRPTAYVILESLMKKGLSTSVEQKTKVYYAAEPPQNLERLLHRQEEEIEGHKKDLIKSLPEFEALFNLSGNRPRVKFYEGTQGSAASYDYFYQNLKAGDTIYSFSPIDDLVEQFPDYLDEHSNERAKLGVWGKIIYTRPEGPIPGFNSKEDRREVRFIPRERFDLHILFSIIPNQRVLIQTFKTKLSSIYIEDPTIANSFKAIWDLAWIAAEKYN